MDQLTATRDRVNELLSRLNASPDPNILNTLRTMVEEMHQLAGLTNSAVRQLEQTLTGLDQRLTSLEVAVGTAVEDATDPQHSTLPSFDTFRTFKDEVAKVKKERR